MNCTGFLLNKLNQEEGLLEKKQNIKDTKLTVLNILDKNFINSNKISKWKFSNKI